MEKNLLWSNLIHERSTYRHGFEAESPWYENWHLTIVLSYNCHKYQNKIPWIGEGLNRN
jgi:hypothetical protein